MKKRKATTDESGMLAAYDFTGGIRGKYAARYAEGTSVVLLRRPTKRRAKVAKPRGTR